MRKTLSARRGGFTLVELLIVVIIIGILAGMMMLTMGSATDGATAARIISDLRNLKAAALLYYVDNNSWPEDGTGGVGTNIARYMDREVFDTKLYGASDVNAILVATITTPLPARVLYGLSLSTLAPGVINKLIEGGAVTNAAGAPIVAGATAVFMAGH